MNHFRFGLAILWIFAFGSFGIAAEIVLTISTPMSPPAWALLERQVLDASTEACRQFYRKY
ncbi:MAG TPA: hypothetical protein VGL71_08050, partial [Urbifossiella sp.]